MLWLCDSAGVPRNFCPRSFFDELAFVRQSALHTDGDSCAARKRLMLWPVSLSRTAARYAAEVAAGRLLSSYLIMAR